MTPLELILVAMSVNDPDRARSEASCLFLDYISINKIDLKISLKQIIKGVIKGCDQFQNCELVGGGNR